MKQPMMGLRWLLCGMILAVLMCIGIAGDQTADNQGNDTYRLSYVCDTQMFRADDISEDDIYIPDPNFLNPWKVVTEGIRASKQTIDGTTVLQLNFRGTFSDDSVGIAFLKSFEFSEYDTLAVPVCIEMEDEDADTRFRVSMEMTLPSEEDDVPGEKYCTSAWVEANSWRDIMVDVSEIDSVESLTVTVSVMNRTLPKLIRFMPIRFENGERYDYIERYKTQMFVAVGGRLTSKDQLLYFFSYGGTSGLEGEFALNELPIEGTQAFMMVTLSGDIQSGTVSMGVRSAESGAIVYGDSDARKLQSGRHVYVFPFTASHDMFSYRLFFRNVDFSGDGICIESVDILFTEDLPLQPTGNGIVSSIVLNRENGRLTLQGSVSQTVFNGNKKDELVVYAVPYIQSSEVSEGGIVWNGTELLRSKVYMNFELVLDAELTARYVGTHMFYIALEGEGHDPILISHPRGADYGRVSDREKSIVGIEGASAVGTFESNASHVIVDVLFDRLVLKVTKPENLDRTEKSQMIHNDITEIYASDGTQILLDREGLRELLAEISFYNSADLRVYLRISNEEGRFVDSIFRLTEWDTEVYSAVLKAIIGADREVMTNAVAGVILGEAVAYSEEHFSLSENRGVYDFAEGLSVLMNVTYSTMLSCLDDDHSAVVVPFMMDGEYNNTVAQMLSFHNIRKNGVPWYVMYCFNVPNNASDGLYVEILEEAELLRSISHTFGADGGAVGCLYFYVPPTDASAEEITLGYNAFCESVQDSDPEAVFLSVRGVVDERKEQLYRLLKNIRKEEKISIIETFDPLYITEEDTAESLMYTVWDFSTLYHNDGWLSGGAVSGCGTERSEIFSQNSGVSQRALRTKVYSNYENSMASAIVLRNFNPAIDFDGVNYVVFRFAVAETAEASTLLFVMGNEQIRAEYTLNDVEPGKVHTVRCPISDFSGKGRLAYIGAMIYSDEMAVLEIQSAALESDTMSPQEMAALFEASLPVVPPKTAVVPVVVGFLAVFTVFAAVLLIRRDREDAELKKESRQTEKIIRK